jgi:preprotein translocase SecE subunit
MAEQKKRRIKQAQTVREQTKAKTEPKSAKKRRIRSATKAAVKPLRVFGFLRFLRFLVPKYFKNSWNELKQVTWPSRKETWKLTLAVFIFAIMFGLLVGVVDYGLDKIFKRILLNL